jgi:DNA-binding transcriptional regulator YiaG
MTPMQFQQALKRLAISQVAAAAQLGVDARTVRRWVAGDRRIPEPVAILIRTWIKHRRLQGARSTH